MVVGQDQWRFDAYFFKAESFEAMEQGTVLALDLIAHDPFAAMRIVLDQEAAIDFQISLNPAVTPPPRADFAAATVAKVS